MRVWSTTPRLLLVAQLCLSILQTSSDILGVKSEDAHLYQQGEGKKAAVFNCLHSDQKIYQVFVNDNYCDCKDGSDEPSTGACSNGKFYCRNEGHIGKTIFASRIHDGICDCCDGSDEKDGNCKDVCQEEHAAYLIREKDNIAKRNAGLIVKKQWIDSAKSDRPSREAKLKAKKEEEEKLKNDKQQAEAKKNKIEAKEKEAKEAHEKKVDLEIHSLLGVFGMSSEVLRKLVVRLAEHDQRMIEKIVKIADELNEQHCDKEKQTCPARTKLDVEEPKQDTSSDSSAPDQGDKNEKEEDAKKEEHPEGVRIQEEIRKIKSGGDAYPGADEARQEYNNIETNLKSVQRDITDLENDIKKDFGPEDVWMSQYGNCASEKIAEYTYEICPLDKVKQDSFSLGTFEKWEDDYATMVYSNGAKCWNGPHRSIKVKLVCGAESKIISVQEPSTCVYEMKYESPAVC